MIETLDDEDQRQRIPGTIRTATAEADVVRLIRAKFSTELLEPVVSHLGAEHAPLRAALVTSQILGVCLARHVIGLEDLASASQDELVAARPPTLQRHLVGNIS